MGAILYSCPIDGTGNLVLQIACSVNCAPPLLYNSYNAGVSLANINIGVSVHGRNNSSRPYARLTGMRWFGQQALRRFTFMDRLPIIILNYMSIFQFPVYTYSEVEYVNLFVHANILLQIRYKTFCIP